MAKLLYKLEFTGTIEVKTGLHIGGSDVDLNIGGIDSEVAKTNGNPYIPGSSLSGKLRSLIAKSLGYKYLNFNAAKENRDVRSLNWDKSYLALLFNGSGFNPDFEERTINGQIKFSDKSNNIVGQNTLASDTRLLIRDDYMLNPDLLLEQVLEDKAENTINRNTGEANPRHIERVVSGTIFQLKMIMNVYEHDEVERLCETLHLGINLLNNDYLGGSGSRGSGEVLINIGKVEKLIFDKGKITRTDFDKYSFNS